MSSYDYLFSCVSWEDRFILGLEKSLSIHDINCLHILAVEEFLDRTRKNKEMALSKFAHKLPEDCLTVSIKDDLESWKKIEEHINKHDIRDKNVLVDLSTMPRCLIWFVLHFLEKNNNRVDYVYYSPGSYSDGDWLSSDPEYPRLVLKHSGIAFPDQKTILLVQTGYDLERVSQLIAQFEPEKILLAVQTGDQLENLERNLDKKKELLSCPEEMLHCFPINAFSHDHGYSEIESQLSHYKDTHNIIMCSLGPKSGAIALYKLNKQYPEYGLVYTPANEYNATYSCGIDDKNVQHGSLATGF